jgi:hypothetical protein
VSTEQVAELAEKLREVPWLAQSLGEPWNPNYDALARVALDHCAAQPAAAGELSDEELALELRRAAYGADRGRPPEDLGDTWHRNYWLAVARRARELCPVPPPEPLVWLRGEERVSTPVRLVDELGSVVLRVGEGSADRVVAFECGAESPRRVMFARSYPGPRDAAHRALFGGDSAELERLRAERDDARILAAARFAEISTLRAELSDARGRLADVIQAASTPGGGA